MTIPVQVPSVSYIGNGITLTFPFAFRLLSTSDLRVTLDDVLQVENVDYTIENLTDLGGDVVFVNPPAVASEILLSRLTPQDQATTYEPFDPFPAKTHEAALDKLTMLIQELEFAEGGGGGGFNPAADQITSGDWVNSGNWFFNGTLSYNDENVATEADLGSKADKSTFVASSDSEMIQVLNPTLGDDINLNLRTNIADGLVKLNSSGKVPPSLLDFTGLELLGGLDPDSGLPPDADPGQFYVITDDGNLLLKDADGVDQATDVFVGDNIIWLDNPVAGWYYVQRSSGPVLATDVIYDNTQVPVDRQLVADNAQTALDEIAIEFAKPLEPEVVEEIWRKKDLSGTEKKIGHGDPSLFVNPGTLQQLHEQSVVRFTGPGPHSIEVPVLEANTPITIITRLEVGDELEITVAGGVTLEWIEGTEADALTGPRSIKRTSVIQLYWTTNILVSLWGNGIE